MCWPTMASQRPSVLSTAIEPPRGLSSTPIDSVELVQRAQRGENVLPEKVNVVTGGRPCQDFNVTSKRRRAN